MSLPRLTAQDLPALLFDAPLHRACLAALRQQDLPDAWIGAGFLRNLVWDKLHGYATATPLADVDVIYFDPADREGRQEAWLETRLAQQLRRAGLQVTWQVRNQARMHKRNGDRPYRDSADALTHWLETPTAVAARLSPEGDQVEILAPLGLTDLLSLTLRPTPHAQADPARLARFHQRVATKRWLACWPRVTLRLS